MAIRSNGDLRSALHTLQFACIGVERELMGNPRLKRSRGSRASGTGNSSTSCVPMSKSSSKEETGLRRVQGNDRDRFLDLFQAIGKILHRPAKCAKQGVEMLLTSRAAHGSNDSLPECSTNFLETGCSRGGAAAMGTPADSFVPELVLQVLPGSSLNCCHLSAPVCVLGCLPFGGAHGRIWVTMMISDQPVKTDLPF